jgi:hypothetical protein
VRGSADETGAFGNRRLLFSIAYGMTRSVGTRKGSSAASSQARRHQRAVPPR